MHEADHGAMEAEQTDTPPESGESRRERLARDHPSRFLAERVAMAIVEVAVGVLGVGALVGVIFGGLLPVSTGRGCPTSPSPAGSLTSAFRSG